MIYKTFYIENTFSAGVAVGSLRSLFAGQSCGEVKIVRELGDSVEVEVACGNPLVMAFAEDKLAEFV